MSDEAMQAGFSAAPGPAEDAAPVTPARLRACTDCGLLQTVPALHAGHAAVCQRCGHVLRRAHRDPLGTALALNFAALSLFGVATTLTMLSVSELGQHHSADVFTGPQGLQSHGMWELGAVVLFATVLAPLLKILGSVYVLIGVRMARPPQHLAWVFAWVLRLRPWSMIEVYLLGVFVAVTKLRDLVHIDIGVALYALFGLLLVLVAADASLDAQTVWEAIERGGPDDAMPPAASPAEGGGRADTAPPLIGCHTCGLVSSLTAEPARCPRCGSALHARKPASIARTWALMVTAAILYIPANLLPVLTVIQLGAGAPSTIIGGAEELLAGGMWPLALLVFFASIAVPMLKITGLSCLLISIQTRRTRHLRDRTVIYRLIEGIGRWSMIDVFMISILVALVQFGALVTIRPGAGAIAFAAVVILTMLAAEAFDPRLMWDAAGASAEPAGQTA